MTTVQLNKSEWQSYFDRLSKSLMDNRAEIEIDSLNLGSQIQGEWLPLHGITYDPKSDVVEVQLEGLDHMIHRPQAAFAAYTTSGLESIAVMSEDDTRHIVKLRDPLMLPSGPIDT